MTTIPDYTIPTNELTISEQIIEYIITQLEAAQFNDSDPNTPLLFNLVDRGTINDLQRKDTPCANVEEGNESKIADLWPYSDKRLRLFVNFKVATTLGVDRFQAIRYYFGRIVKVLVTEDEALGGLAIDITEAGNTPEVNGKSDPEPGGTVIFDIHYRHRYGDMFTGL